MSVEFSVIFPVRPHIESSRWLAWDEHTGRGTFAGMYLTLRPVEARDPLPDPGWRERAQFVLRADGRLTEETFDPFDDWLFAIARAHGGAIFDAQQGRFRFVPFDEVAATASANEQLSQGEDLGALAAELEKQRVVGRVNGAFRAIARTVVARLDEAAPTWAPLLVPLYRGREALDPQEARRIAEAILAARAWPAAGPGLDAAALQHVRVLADSIEAQRAEQAPLPNDLSGLEDLLRKGLRGDRGAQRLLDRALAQKRFESAMGPLLRKLALEGGAVDQEAIYWVLGRAPKTRDPLVVAAATKGDSMVLAHALDGYWRRI